MDCDQVVQKKQVEVSSPKAPLSIAGAAKISPHNESKLRRLVASGRLHSVTVELDPNAKRRRGRQTRIWVYLDDIRALIETAAGSKAVKS